MTAQIYKLPQAATEPVKQSWRGRYPKSVGRFCDVQFERYSQQLDQQTIIEEIERVKRSIEMNDEFTRHLKGKLAELSAARANAVGVHDLAAQIRAENARWQRG